ncbi:MAG: hypothetical protein CMR00_04555, partial [[Chlorobium] sp. 445]
MYQASRSFVSVLIYQRIAFGVSSMTDYKPMILKGYLSPKGHLRDITDYEAQGGYQMLKKAFAMKPDDIVNEVKKSGLKG